jgi:hypothetical protein
VTPGFRTLHARATGDWRNRGAGELLALLAEPLPWDVRRALTGDNLIALATLPDGSAREPWLSARVASAAAGDDPPGRNGPETGDIEDLLTTVRHLAAGKAWRLLDAEGPGLKLAIPGEHDLPPVAVVPCPTGLRVERPLPLLPVRDADPVVRVAVAHGILVLNGVVRAARVAIRDPRTLTAAVEFVLPLDEPDDEALDCALEGVRHAALHATGVIDLLRNPAVASVYAAAHNLSPAPSEREPFE